MEAEHCAITVQHFTHTWRYANLTGTMGLPPGQIDAGGKSEWFYCDGNPQAVLARSS